MNYLGLQLSLSIRICEKIWFSYWHMSQHVMGQYWVYCVLGGHPHMVVFREYTGFVVKLI